MLLKSVRDFSDYLMPSMHEKGIRYLDCKVFIDKYVIIN